MACLRASFASFALLRSSASMRRLGSGPSASGALHVGQRLAKPGLFGFNSNSSEQTTQTLMGKGIRTSCYDSQGKFMIRVAQSQWDFAMGTRRAHIVVPEQLLAEIDAEVGPRGRSAFLVETAQGELRRRPLLTFLARMTLPGITEIIPNSPKGRPGGCAPYARKVETRIPAGQPSIPLLKHPTSVCLVT